MLFKVLRDNFRTTLFKNYSKNKSLKKAKINLEEDKSLISKKANKVNKMLEVVWKYLKTAKME